MVRLLGSAPASAQRLIVVEPTPRICVACLVLIHSVIFLCWRGTQRDLRQHCLDQTDLMLVVEFVYAPFLFSELLS